MASHEEETPAEYEEGAEYDGVEVSEAPAETDTTQVCTFPVESNSDKAPQNFPPQSANLPDTFFSSGDRFSY
jgi:hypothetical protein